MPANDAFYPLIGQLYLRITLVHELTLRKGNLVYRDNSGGSAVVEAQGKN
jgi:hypothetical protein